ncbi:MAG: GNAT family N-acetyltransferase, partial [Burkholderiaceae bacterium]|nr:GNAT family N-acetyltransferase [Burkholderiaceae bacterium]
CSSTILMCAIPASLNSESIGFYERLGFKPIDSEFNEAGIAHIKMVLEHR